MGFLGGKGEWVSVNRGWEGALGRLDGKHLQILDLQRLASLPLCR